MLSSLADQDDAILAEGSGDDPMETDEVDENILDLEPEEFSDDDMEEKKDDGIGMTGCMSW